MTGVSPTTASITTVGEASALLQPRPVIITSAETLSTPLPSGSPCAGKNPAEESLSASSSSSSSFCSPAAFSADGSFARLAQVQTMVQDLRRASALFASSSSAASSQPLSLPTLFFASEVRVGEILGKGTFGTVLALDSLQLYRKPSRRSTPTTPECTTTVSDALLPAAIRFFASPEQYQEIMAEHNHEDNKGDKGDRKNNNNSNAVLRTLSLRNERRRHAMQYGQSQRNGCRCEESNHRAASTKETASCSSSQYVVKRIREGGLQSDRSRMRATLDLCAEALLLNALPRHPHIIELYGCVSVPGEYELNNKKHHRARSKCSYDNEYENNNIHEFALILGRLQTTLDRKVKEWKEQNQPAGIFLWSQTRKRRAALLTERLVAATQTASALAFLHSHNFLYRDLKPSNLGLDSQGNVRLFDFGTTKELKQRDHLYDDTYRCTRGVGSRRWMAPEVCITNRYGLSADVYSFGLVLWHLCTLQTPFQKHFDRQNHLQLVVRLGKRPKVPSYLSPELRQLITSCWSVNPAERPSMEEVYQTLQHIICPDCATPPSKTFDMIGKRSDNDSIQETVADSCGEEE